MRNTIMGHLIGQIEIKIKINNIKIKIDNVKQKVRQNVIRISIFSLELTFFF